MKNLLKTKLLYLLFLFVVGFATSCAFMAVTKTSAPKPQLRCEEGEVKNDAPALVSLLRQDRNLLTLSQWGELVYTIRTFDADQEFPRGGSKLTIQNKSGAMIYEEKADSFGNVFIRRLLPRSRASQMIIEANYGGTANYLLILNNENGNILEISPLPSDKDALGFDADAEIVPQFVKGKSAPAEPYQILLTSPFVSSHYYTKVYRFLNGKYRYAGEFSRQEIDKLIEEKIKR